MRVNGTERALTQPQNLQEFLTEQGYDWRRIAVERNGEIVPKGTYETVQLEECDVIEVVSFMGGG